MEELITTVYLTVNDLTHNSITKILSTLFLAMQETLLVYLLVDYVCPLWLICVVDFSKYYVHDACLVVSKEKLVSKQNTIPSKFHCLNGNKK